MDEISKGIARMQARVEAAEKAAVTDDRQMEVFSLKTRLGDLVERYEEISKPLSGAHEDDWWSAHEGAKNLEWEWHWFMVRNGLEGRRQHTHYPDGIVVR